VRIEGFFRVKNMTRIASISTNARDQITPRHVEVDGLKAVAIVGIIILHMSFRSRMDAAALALVDMLQLLFGWSVIAFFFASGLLTRAVKDFTTLSKFAFNRFKRLLMPCVVFSWSYKFLLVVSAGLDIGNNTGPTAFDAVEFLFAPVGPQFYFLPMLYAISMCIAVTEIWLSERGLILAAGGILLMAYQFIPLPLNGYGASVSLLPVYMFSYVAGRVLSPLTPGRKAEGSLAIFGFVLAGCLGYSTLVLLYAYIPILLFMLFNRWKDVAKMLVASGLGKNSSAIYVWHAPVILPFVSIVCSKIFGHSAVILLPMLCLTIVLCIVLGKATASYRFLRFWRF
jgi:hypothetical protein